MNAEERVWKRKEESTVKYRNWDKGLSVDTGYDVKKLRQICSEEGTTLEKFQDYAINRKKAE